MSALQALADEKARLHAAAKKNSEYVERYARGLLEDDFELGSEKPSMYAASNMSSMPMSRGLGFGGGGASNSDFMSRTSDVSHSMPKASAWDQRMMIPTPAAALTPASTGPKQLSVYVQGLPIHVPSAEIERALYVLCTTVGTCRKVKMYKHPGTDISKGDALVTFSDESSAQQAALQLNGKEIHPLCKMSVTIADFSKSTNKTANAAAATAEPEEASAPLVPAASGPVFEAIPIATEPLSKAVLLHNIFDRGHNSNPYLGHKGKAEVQDISEEVEAECNKFGVVNKFLQLKSGSVALLYDNAEQAGKCVEIMHGRWFCDKQIVADYVLGVGESKGVSHVVMLQNVFDPSMAQSAEGFVQQLEVDFMAECINFGPMRSLEVHPDDGSIHVTFESRLSAADCVRAMDARPFDGKTMIAEFALDETISNAAEEEARNLLWPPKKEEPPPVQTLALLSDGSTALVVKEEEAAPVQPFWMVDKTAVKAVKKKRKRQSRWGQQ